MIAPQVHAATRQHKFAPAATLCCGIFSSGFLKEIRRSFIAQNYFALSNDLLVEPQAILERSSLHPHPRRPAQQPHPRRSLENIRGKRAAIDVKFHPQIPRIGDPRNLISGIQHHRLRDKSDKYRPFSHRCIP